MTRCYPDPGCVAPLLLSDSSTSGAKESCEAEVMEKQPYQKVVNCCQSCVGEGRGVKSMRMVQWRKEEFSAT